MGIDLNPFNALADFFLGVLRQRKLQQVAAVAISFAMSAMITALSTWGLAIIAGEGFLRACAISAVAVSVILLQAWLRHPVTKNLKLFWLGDLEKERIRMLQEKNVISSGEDK